jgi:hypothetical protein
MDPTTNKQAKFCEDLTNQLINMCIEKYKADVFTTTRRRCEVNGVLFRDNCLKEPMEVDKSSLQNLTVIPPPYSQQQLAKN